MPNIHTSSHRRNLGLFYSCVCSSLCILWLGKSAFYQYLSGLLHHYTGAIIRVSFVRYHHDHSLRQAVMYSSSLQWRHMKVPVSQITGRSTVCSAVWAGLYERKHQSPRYWPFVSPSKNGGNNVESVPMGWRHHAPMNIHFTTYEYVHLFVLSFFCCGNMQNNLSISYKIIPLAQSYSCPHCQWCNPGGYW